MVKLLERCAIRRRVTAGIRCVEAVDGLFAKRFGKFFQGSRLAAAQKDLRVHVAHNRIRIIFVDSFQLTAGLQDKAG